MTVAAGGNTNTNERQPLLGNPQGTDHDVENPSGSAAASPPTKQRSWWTIGWYAFWSILSIFGLAVFIKGFIDADDVEVSTPFDCDIHIDTTGRLV